MSQTKKTTALIILDGWGHREEQDSNAIAHANTPVLDGLCSICVASADMIRPETGLAILLKMLLTRCGRAFGA